MMDGKDCGKANMSACCGSAGDSSPDAAAASLTKKHTLYSFALDTTIDLVTQVSEITTAPEPQGYRLSPPVNPPPTQVLRI
jgi:hypothetical protein